MKQTIQDIHEKKVIQIRPYTRKELAQIYGVCSRTFKKWLMPFEAEIGKQHGRLYSIPQVKIIFEKLSLPSFVTLE